MTENETGPAGFGNTPVAGSAVVRKRGISIVWIIPVIALLVGAFVAWRVLSARGPEITVSFLTAEGIEAGKTQVKFKDVSVGQVEDVTISRDLSRVICTIRMSAGADAYLRDKTRFWIVKPRLAGGQVSGLGTLLSGAYIAVDPATEGNKLKSFVGLEVPPVVGSDVAGRYFVLKSNRAGAVEVGLPIYFRKFPAGQVVSSELGAGDVVTTRVFIRAPYDRRVTTDSRFWMASGIDATIGANGVQIQTESLAAIVTGGLAFDELGASALTDGPAGPAEEAPAETVFKLYENRTIAQQPEYTRTVSFLVQFDQSVRGLRVGAPVEFRGIEIGQVMDVRLVFDRQTGRFRIPVIIEVDSQRVSNVDLGERKRHEILDNLVKSGLRAQLKSANLLTGQLVVYLDMYKNPPPAKVNWSGPHPELPTIPSPVAEIAASLAQLSDRLSKVPVEQIGTDLAAALKELREALAGAKDVGPALTKTLQAADRTLKSTDALIGPDSTTNEELRRALMELSDAARALGLAAQQIEAQPDSVIFGEEGEPVMLVQTRSSLNIPGLLLLAIVLAGCSRAALPDFYTLSNASGTEAGAPIAARPDLGLVVGPVDFPRYLDRQEIVTRDGSHQLIVADAHRWGGSLRTDILRVVADDLGRLLGTSRVAMYPTEPRFAANYRVLLDIREFEGSAGGNVVLRARWTIASVKDGAAVAVEESRVEQAPASGSIADLVAAESTALAKVTRQIAERLAALPQN